MHKKCVIKSLLKKTPLPKRVRKDKDFGQGFHKKTYININSAHRHWYVVIMWPNVQGKQKGIKINSIDPNMAFTRDSKLLKHTVLMRSTVNNIRSRLSEVMRLWCAHRQLETGAEHSGPCAARRLFWATKGHQSLCLDVMMFESCFNRRALTVDNIQNAKSDVQ